MHEPNIRGNAAGQAFKPGVLTGRYQPRILDEIDDGWIGVIDRTGFGIHPIHPRHRRDPMIQEIGSHHLTGGEGRCVETNALRQ